MHIYNIIIQTRGVFMAIRDITRFGIQRKIVANMTSESWQNIPHVSYLYEPDVTHFLECFEEFKEKVGGKYHITLNMVVLKTIAEAIKAAPQINAHIHFERKLVRGKITEFDNVDISVPWTLPDGNMMTITMKDMGNRSLENISRYTDEINRKLQKTNLAEALYSVSIHDTVYNLTHGHPIKAFQRIYGSKTNPRHRVVTLKGKEKKEYDKIPESERITYRDLKQGTITVSNIGSISRGISGELGLLRIIPPQICAIGIGALQKKPIVVTDETGKDEIKISTVLPICVCFDHRALDFGEVKPFIAKLEEIFENPEIILK